MFIHSGEYFFGDQDYRVRTLLGSCVSITFWHPNRLLGGICHIVLPSRNQTPSISHASLADIAQLNAKYADEALLLMLKEIQKVNTEPKDYQVKVFGGGNMFLKKNNDSGEYVGHKNVKAVQLLLSQYGFKCQASHLGGRGYRHIIFDILTGEVWMKFTKHMEHKAHA